MSASGPSGPLVFMGGGLVGVQTPYPTSGSTHVGQLMFWSIICNMLRHGCSIFVAFILLFYRHNSFFSGTYFHWRNKKSFPDKLSCVFYC